MSRIDPNPLAIERSFKEKLKGKSRRRREDLARLAAPGGGAARVAQRRPAAAGDHLSAAG